ncbi:CUB and sushi domain-containing protein 3-like [Patiria miniata]|uniref:Uncharacterized protein n=1 Tax=Patiria miniata TaxID=46514 RepID=A0A913ZT54_PATMI|nr:CUB and sushi domain-containing protein 3-like [Patiria miniata]
MNIIMHCIVHMELCLFVDCIFLLLCQVPPMKAQSPREGSVRLRRGINSQSGYVEIFHSGQWGRVCDTAWDHNDAHVVCKQQGYNGAKFPATDFTELPNPGLPLVLDNLQCTGRETALADCNKGEWGPVENGCQTARVECMSYAAQYIGCFADDTDRLLSDYSRLCAQGKHDPRCAGCDHTNTACDSSIMTVEICIEICCTDNDFVYAGVEAGDECYCGDAAADYNRIGRLPEVLCNTQCSGNPEQSCGSDYKIDVYDCSSGCEAPTVDKPNLKTFPTMLQTTLYKTGEMLTFYCTPGYQLSGNATISCQPGGPWSAPVPDCVETTSTEIPAVSDPCSYPTTTPQNGQYLPEEVEYQPGSTVQLSCNSGYLTAGNPTLTCQSDGTWTTENHACPAVDCGPLPAFQHAIPSTSLTTYETTVTFTCEAGYQLSGDVTGKTCDASGGWAGEDPQCAGGSTCGSPPFPSRGLLIPFKPLYQPDETVKFSCFAGFEVDGATNATCRNDGTWSDSVPTCQMIDCGPLPVYQFVTPVTTATVFATSVTFRCDDNYHFANGATPFKTCDADGQWVGIDPVCELTTCPPLAKYSKAIQSTDVTVVNTVVTFTCETGNELQDSEPIPTKTCTSEGVWEGPDPVCRMIDCGPLPVYPFVTPVTTQTVFETSVTFQCDDNYQFANGATPFKTCDADGQWVGTDPVCELSTCPPLAKYSKAIQSTDVTVVNTVVTFTCETGNELQDSEPIPTKTCTSEGVWEGPDPVCRLVNCGPLDEAPPGVVVNATDYTFNSAVTYSCNNSDQIILGNATLYCLSNGNWSSDLPTCANGTIFTTAGVSKGAESNPGTTIPFFIWIVLLLLVVCLILLIASYIVYRVHTRSYKKYKKENSDNGLPSRGTQGVPLHGIAISDPHHLVHDNYAMSQDEEGDTGVASNESDLQDVSLGSESNYRYLGNAYAESLHSGSVQPSGTNDSGMYPSDPESNSLGTDVAGGAGAAHGEQAGDDRDGDKHEVAEKKDKDFIDDMLDSAKEKLDNCVVQ